MSRVFRNIRPGNAVSMLADAAPTRASVLPLVLVLAAGLASGCASYERDQTTTASIPDDYRLRHPIIVSQSETVKDIPVSASAKSMSPRDESVTRQFVADFKRSGASVIAIIIPAGSPNEAAARRVAHDAVHILREEGLPDSRIHVEHYSAGDHGASATLRLAFADLKAEVASQCGNWNEDLIFNPENRNYWNFGCATQKNLAAQIANPKDLLGPRGVSEIDAARRTILIQDWQGEGTRPLTPLF